MSSASSSSSRSKQVRFNLTVEEYHLRDSPESWTSPLPSKKPIGGSTLKPAAPTRAGDPHPALSPQHALLLDFSFPSEAFRNNPQLTPALLSSTACSTPCRSLDIRIAASSGLYKTRVQVVHSGGGGGSVTVGDVLTTIQNTLRQPDADVDKLAAAVPYTQRRIDTVNGYRFVRDERAEARRVAEERHAGGRVVDRFLGETQFAGIAMRPDGCWELKLTKPARYRFLLNLNIHSKAVYMSCCPPPPDHARDRTPPQYHVVPKMGAAPRQIGARSKRPLIEISSKSPSSKTWMASKRVSAAQTVLEKEILMQGI
ncbi:hypothetical protein FB45DRAFT_1010148 [Roridomyces roridus]|uniref:DUF6699 domain-containing protein n=1 Tax=Roridomyces roridus TaxID=1738132 RepID=A0AAD7F943_9AGAR|nr:hypothetical protein FB45DRAFT_1010148 [Roridomyces roridus]